MTTLRSIKPPALSGADDFLEEIWRVKDSIANEFDSLDQYVNYLRDQRPVESAEGGAKPALQRVARKRKAQLSPQAAAAA
jgi:hypothetical protein